MPARDRSAGMIRRQLTLIVAAVLLLLLVTLAWLLPVPFVQMRPGPAVDTLGSAAGKDFITVQGHPTFATTGRLDLTTVTITAPGQRLPLVALLTGWIDPKTAIVPSSYIYPPTLSVSEVEQLNAEEMTGSQETAVAAGLRQAGVTVTDRVVVQAIAENAPALGHLKAGDFILTVDGKQVSSTEGLRADIRAHQPGERIRFGIERDGTPMTETVTAGPAPDDPKVAAVGITPAIGYDSDVDVSVNLPQQIGGPSAGMMFALALYDKLTPGPLAGGRTVAGTGTIDPDGTVGPIGGIQQKVNGAKAAGATVFLAPASDCDSAGSAHVDGITVYRIEKLQDSVDVLTELNQNKPVTVATCGRS